VDLMAQADGSRLQLLHLQPSAVSLSSQLRPGHGLPLLVVRLGRLMLLRRRPVMCRCVRVSRRLVRHRLLRRVMKWLLRLLLFLRRWLLLLLLVTAAGGPLAGH
jgi:hypothetical protein